MVIEHNLPKSFLPFRLALPYHVHYFSLDEDNKKEIFCDSFKKWGLSEYIKNCILFTKVSTTNGLSKLIEKLNAGEDFKEQPEFLKVAHTDLWIILPTKWKIRRYFCKSEIKTKGQAKYVLYGPHEAGIPFNLYQVKISEDVDKFKEMSFINLEKNEIVPFSFWIEFIQLNMLETYQRIIAFLGLFSFAFIFVKSKLIALIIFLVGFLLYYFLEWLRDKLNRST